MHHARHGLKAHIRKAVRQLALSGCALAGRYEPFRAADLETCSAERVDFEGDLPRLAGPVRNQYKLVYVRPRDPVIWADEKVLYTARGQAWSGGTLRRRHSIRDPSPRELAAGPGSPTARLPVATLLQCEYPYSYGDWVSEGLLSLAAVEPLDMPLLLPDFLARKAYVQADAKRLGFECRAVESTVQIDRARVLQKTYPLMNVPTDGIRQLRARLGLRPPDPRPGSLLYLSRAGETSEVFQRHMPHDVIEPVMRQLGARIVHCRDWRYDDYHRLAEDAETVVADFGSAAFNLIQWKTRRLIQLYSEAWWDGWGLFVAQATGVSSIAMLCVDGIDATRLEQRLRRMLEGGRDARPITSPTAHCPAAAR